MKSPPPKRAAHRSWRAKLEDDKGLPKVQPITPSMSQRWGQGTVVIPSPREVDALMRQVPKGKITNNNEIRDALARKHGATIACPLTTGIFAWIAAHAAEEDAQSGTQEITPYWRTLKANGALNPKYPGGVEAQARKLEAEGIAIHSTPRNKGMKVMDWDRFLHRF